MYEKADSCLTDGVRPFFSEMHQQTDGTRGGFIWE
jgi:hypothetical protein